MTRIKIYGITNIDDAAEAGADALGFIGVPSSPRYVSTDAYEEMGRTSGGTMVSFLYDGGQA